MYLIISKKEELISQFQIVFLVQRLANKKGQLVCVLTRRRHAYSTRPIIVHVSELVAELLDVIRFQSARVPNYIVVSRIDCALGRELRNQIKVVPFLLLFVVILLKYSKLMIWLLFFNLSFCIETFLTIQFWLLCCQRRCQMVDFDNCCPFYGRILHCLVFSRLYMKHVDF